MSVNEGWRRSFLVEWIHRAERPESSGVSNVFLRLASSCGISTEVLRASSCGILPGRPNRFVCTSEGVLVSFVQVDFCRKD